MVNILRKLKDITESRKSLQNEIKTEIKTIFKELDCEDAFYAVEFNDYSVWVHLDESYCISTDLFSELDKFFKKSGVLSYSDGDGFIISFKW